MNRHVLFISGNILINLFTYIPRFLRDSRILFDRIRDGHNTKEHLFYSIVSAILCLAVFGFAMGLSHSVTQALASAAKMPLLFLLPTLVCIPALYFFGLTLLGMRMGFVQLATVVFSGVGISAYVLMGLSPILLFFVLTNPNYAFAQLLSAGFVAIAGIIGLGHVWRGLLQLGFAQTRDAVHIGRPMLGVWLALYGFVGSQMAWWLSPLVGKPGGEFIWRAPSKDGSFLTDVVQALRALFVSGTNASTVISLFLALGLIAALVGVVMLMVRRQGRELPIALKPGAPPRVLGDATASPRKDIPR